MLGTTLRGRYKIISKLGEGGFGETYLAGDMDLPGLPHCVVKRLKSQFSNLFVLQTATRLFDREAQVLYKLGHHDQIPRLLAHFEENQNFYLVQEFIDGNDLSKELLPERQWQEAQVIAFIQNVLQILEFVHQQNVIHRDLKPANLIRRTADGKIVLIDFGAVKEEINTLVADTPGATVIGTPGYTPSEQKGGNPKFNSDIYALGMICIQAITGVHPYNLAKDPEVKWNKQVVSPQFAAILDKMVCSNFQMRYQSVTEVLQALSSLTKDNESGSQTKKIAFVGLAVVFLSLAVAIPIIQKIGSSPDKSSPTKIDFLTYKNPIYGIEMKYPQSWKKQEIGTFGDIAKFSSPLKTDSNTSQAEVTIEIQNLKQPISLAEYTNAKVNEITQYLTNAKIHDSGSTTLANQPAHEVIYSGKQEQYNVKRKAVWLLKNKKAYIITYTAEENQYDDFLKPAQDMINSLFVVAL
ncbi:MAG: protein kinase [Rhizonema sp. PD37]|nr:protein kinase [Rhizonema sp. PD37]